MKIIFDKSVQNVAPEKIGLAAKVFYQYLEEISGGKFKAYGATLYIAMKDEDGDGINFGEGDKEIFWEVRDTKRVRADAEKNLVFEGEGIYIYAHAERR